MNKTFLFGVADHQNQLETLSLVRRMPGLLGSKDQQCQSHCDCKSLSLISRSLPGTEKEDMTAAFDRNFKWSKDRIISEIMGTVGNRMEYLESNPDYDLNYVKEHIKTNDRSILLKYNDYTNKGYSHDDAMQAISNDIENDVVNKIDNLQPISVGTEDRKSFLRLQGLEQEAIKEKQLLKLYEEKYGDNLAIEDYRRLKYYCDIQFGESSDTVTCPECCGNGRLASDLGQCPTCGGDGTVWR